MKLPPLLDERPPALWFTLIGVGPVLLGAIAGLLLPVSEIGYLVVSVIGIGGGFFAGLEHRGAIPGLGRGIVGGLLFGVSILAFKEVGGGEPKAELPEPETVLVLITVGFGAILGALGGRRRAKRDPGPARPA